MTDELTRLLLDDDHKRLCEGRGYACSCGYDDAVQAAAEQARIADDALREALCFVGKWVERGQFDKHISPAEAISMIAHYPGMPWNSERWDVDHKPYAAVYYARFPKTAALASEEPTAAKGD